MSSGEYINDLILPTLSDFGSNINVNLEGDYKLLVDIFKRFTDMFPETELLNAVEIENWLNTLGDDMVRLGFTESDINLQLNKEKHWLKDLLKPGESIEAYYYQTEQSKAKEKKREKDRKSELEREKNNSQINQAKNQDTKNKTKKWNSKIR